MKDRNETTQLCKIVYFDEDSVTDYVQMVDGGELEKTTELLKKTTDSVKGEVDLNAKIGFSDVVKALFGVGASVETGVGLQADFDTSNIAKNIVKNTMLTDFVNIIYDSQNKGEDSTSKPIKKFTGYKITAPKESLSYVALISPYLSILKGGTSIPAGDFDIAIEKLDNTIKSAKGYYEFIGERGKKEIIFRFNIKSFKNNYKATDLMKMNISIFAIRVGKSSIDNLNFNKEFEIENVYVKKDNPDYELNKEIDITEKQEKELDVYDVLLAGVEYNG